MQEALVRSVIGSARLPKLAPGYCLIGTILLTGGPIKLAALLASLGIKEYRAKAFALYSLCVDYAEGY